MREMREPRRRRDKKGDSRSPDRIPLVAAYAEWLDSPDVGSYAKLYAAHLERFNHLTYEQILLELERLTRTRKGTADGEPSLHHQAFRPAANYAAAFLIHTQALLLGTPANDFSPSRQSKRLGSRGRAAFTRFWFDVDWKRRGKKGGVLANPARDEIASEAAALLRRVTRARRLAGPDRDQFREELRPIVGDFVPARNVEAELRKLVKSRRIETVRIVAHLLNVKYPDIPQLRVLELLRAKN